MASPIEVFKAALLKFRNLPRSNNVRKYRRRLNSVIEGTYIVSLGNVNGISTDPLEDIDDDFLWKYGLPIIPGKTYILVSNGKHSCQARFDYIKMRQPYYASAEWNIPFQTKCGILIFLQDGKMFPEPLDVFINAGPMSAFTTHSILMKQKSLVVTVGANDDFTAAGINQTATDGGKEEWNEWIQTVSHKVNLDVSLSRYVLFPAMPGYEKEMITTTSMFIACRPPPECLRINEGNSIINAQLYEDICDYTDLECGLASLQEYMELTKSKGLPSTHYEAAAIPIVFTNILGGRYAKGGPFGYNPSDLDAKERVACLLPETVPLFKENISKFTRFTPAYDVLALIMAVVEYNKL